MMKRIEETRSSRTEDFMRDIDKAVNVILNSGLDVEKIYLFGSYAYGEPNDESDIDLYVVLSDESKPRIRAIDAMEKIGMEIFKSDVYNVEVLAGFEGDFLARASLPTMEKTVFDKGVTLYERTAFHSAGLSYPLLYTCPSFLLSITQTRTSSLSNS